MISTRALGKTGVEVTELGLGGEGILRSYGRDREAAEVIESALASGIRYIDTAPAYAGSMDYLGATLGNRRPSVFLASKTSERGRDRSLASLDEGLHRLQTDYLDLWQLHDLRTPTDLKRVFGRRGAIHALDEARSAGATRFVGVTGHHRPDVIMRAIREYEFDAVMIPLNPADHTRLPFMEVLEEARAQGLGVIAIKVLSGGLLLELELCSLHEALNYTWSLPGVSVVLVGYQTRAEVEASFRVAVAHQKMTATERRALEKRCAFATLTPYKSGAPRAVAQ